MFRTTTTVLRHRTSLNSCNKIIANTFATLTSADASTKSQELPAGWDSAKPFTSVPGPPTLPIIGNYWRLFLNFDFLTLSEKMEKTYGDVVNIRQLLQNGDMVFLFNVKDIEWMFRNEGPWPIRDGLKSHSYYRSVLRKELFGNSLGLVSGQNEEWGSFRNAVNPIMMQPRTTNQYMPHINNIMDEFLVRLRSLDVKYGGEMPDDFMEELKKWAFESVALIALDTRLGCLQDNPSERTQKAIVSAMEILALLLKVDFLPFGGLHRKFKTRTWKRFVESQDFLAYMVMDLIEQTIERIQNDPNYHLKPEHEKSVFEKLVIKDKHIAITMIVDMFGAGIDTTSKAVGGMLYHLARNPEAQNKLRKELRTLLPKKDTPVTKEILEQAKYLRACIRESFRITPAATMTLRRSSKPIVLGGYQIPSGTLLVVPNLYLSLTTDKYYSNPKKYLPERWTREGKLEEVSPFISLPFGFGARSCIGKRIATMEIEVFLSKMIRNYELEWKHKEMTFKQELLYGLVDPLKLSIKEVPE